MTSSGSAARSAGQHRRDLSFEDDPASHHGKDLWSSSSLIPKDLYRADDTLLDLGGALPHAMERRGEGRPAWARDGLREQRTEGLESLTEPRPLARSIDPHGHGLAARLGMDNEQF